MLGSRPTEKYISEQQANLVFSMDSLSAKHRQQAELVLRYIREAKKRRISRGQRSALGQLIAECPELADGGCPPSVNSLMRWMRIYEDSHGSLAAVVSKRALRRGRARRLDGEVLGVAQRLIRDRFCTTDRLSLARVKTEIDREIEKKTACGEIQARQPKLSYTTLRRLRDEIDPYARDVARMGKFAAENHWRYSLRGLQLSRALERYEIDHTIIDLVCVCDRTGLPLGRPTLTVVVDAFSGYVVGLYISFWSTGLATTFRAFRVAINPKDDFNPLLETCPWVGYGIPELLAVDNGLEFHSPQFTRMALMLLMDLEYCKVRTPWLKPFVERSLGAYIQYLPEAGRVRKPSSNDLPDDPNRSAAVTFSSLCLGVLKIFTEIHAQEINQRKLCRPIDRFTESFESLRPPTMESDLEALDVIVAPRKQLTVGNEGIVHNYLRFNSYELKDLWRSTAHRFKTEVAFDVESLGHIWVKDPKSGSYLRVPCTTPEYAEGLTLIQHRAIRRSLKDDLNQRNAPEKLLRAKGELIDFWASRTKQGKRLARDHLQALSGLTLGKTLLGPGASSGPTVAPALMVDPGELAVPPRDIPVFSGIEMC